MFINFAGVCEGMAMGAKAGIHPQALLDVIKTSTGDSMYLRRTIGLLLEGEDVNSAADLAVKDVHLAVELGRELDIPIELGPLVEDIFRRFCDAGRGQEDQLEIMRDFMRRSGVDAPKRKSA
jgi:3-hydroxyisobutyrate dehydrogenase-like beta-hydroxyacid dehydrogenase